MAKECDASLYVLLEAGELSSSGFNPSFISLVFSQWFL